MEFKSAAGSTRIEAAADFTPPANYHII